jgi:hypothetical protein
MADAAKTETVERFFFNGVDAETGGPLWDPLTLEEIVRRATVESSNTPPDEQKAIGALSRRKSAPHYGMDIDDLSDPTTARWGVIFADGESASIRQAIAPLIDHRARQLGGEPRIFEVAPNASAVDFLRDNGVERGLGKVALVPYYLLIVGDPARIPFRFQMDLNTEYATGRLDFDSADGYAAYVARLIAYEQAASLPNRREAAFWAPERSIDPATSLSAPQLAQPLFDGVDDGLGFEKRLFRGDLTADGAAPATRDNLRRLLAGPTPPSLLFTASHGLGYRKPDPRQLKEHGALLCQEYVWGKPTAADQLYGGGDLARDRADGDPLGLIHVAFACFGAGTPQHDDYAIGEAAPERLIAERPFVADLPRQLLARGALAFIGHVDRAWSYSFAGNGPAGLPGAITPAEALQRALARLLKGGPVGHALRDEHDRGVNLSSSLLEDIAARRRRIAVSELDLANKWIERNDARAYVVLGDPAARLRVSVIGASDPGGPRFYPAVPLPPPPSSDAPAGSDGSGANGRQGTGSIGDGASPPAGVDSGVGTTPATPDHARRVAGHDRAAESFLPPVSSGRDPGIDADLLAAWSQHIRDGFQQNATMFERVLRAFMVPYWLTVAMYSALFLVGVGGFLVAAYLAAARELGFAAIFGGLSATAFLTFFVTRPLRSLEQNLTAITWLGIVYNTYWTRLMYATDAARVQQDLEAITRTALKDLGALMSRHDKLAAKRPDLPAGDGQPRDQPSPPAA